MLVHAENHETDDQTVDFIPEGYYENIEQYLIDKKLTGGFKLRFQNSYKMTRYAQADYSEKLLNCKTSTISSHGCALVAMTMVSNSLAGYDKFTPITANNLLKNYISCSMNWSEGARRLGFTLDAIVTSSHNQKFENAIEIALDKNKRVIIQMKDSKGAYHYVTVFAYYINSGNMTIYIRDPGSNNYRTLSDMECADRRWRVDKYYVFR